MDQYKRFHKSNSILYQYNQVQYPLCVGDQTFVRKCVRITAAPNIGREDIVSEFKSHVTDLMYPVNFQYRTMMTLYTETPDFIVAMSTHYVEKLIKGMMENERNREGSLLAEAELFTKKLYDFADEMIYYRDHP